MIRTNCIVKEDDMSSINKNKYLSLTEKSFYKKLGKVTKIVGLTIESVGLMICAEFILRITVRNYMQR